MRRVENIDLELGDLVAALTEETVQLVADEKLAHSMVSYMLCDVLNHQSAILKNWH